LIPGDDGEVMDEFYPHFIELDKEAMTFTVDYDILMDDYSY
jgi:hypothetical protein